MVDQTFHWSEADWSAKPVQDFSTGETTRCCEHLSNLLLKYTVALSAALLLGSTIFGYFLIQSHIKSFDHYSNASRLNGQTIELTKGITALDHAELRFSENPMDDERTDIHHMLHDLYVMITKMTASATQPEIRQELAELDKGLDDHQQYLMGLKPNPDHTRTDQNARFSQISPDRLYGPVARISSFATDQAKAAEIDFNTTSNQMWFTIGIADLAILFGGVSLFILHRRRVKTLAYSQTQLSRNNRTLQDAVADRTTRLGQVETMFKSSLAASNMTMFIQNTDLVLSWIHNPSFGTSDALIGKRDEDFMPREASVQTVKAKMDVIKSGVGKEFDYSYTLDGRLIHKWLHLDPILEDGTVIGIIGVSLDVTERRQREARIEALAAELAHRNQNLIAVISSIARRMFKTSQSLGEFEHRFTTSLHAIARSFELIVRDDWQGAPLRELICTQIQAVDGALMDRITLKGNDVLARPDCAEAIGSAIHELTQNAVEYGALAKASGKITIDWWIETDLFGKSQFFFVWQECDGSQDTPSLGYHGYGFNVLERIVPKSLNGTGYIAAQPGGLKWRMRCAWPSQVSQKMEEVVYLKA